MPNASAIDVAIIGAGIAGLAAAHTLKQRGWRVVVFEAGDRVGGRMTTDYVDGQIVDRGAQFLSTGYTVIPRLLRETGLAGQLRPTAEYSAIVRAGRPRRGRPDSPLDALQSGLLGWRSLLKFGWQTLRLGQELRRRSVSDFSQWAEFDRESTADWLGRGGLQEILEYLYEPMLHGYYFQTPEETSRALGMVLTAFGLRRARTLALADGLGRLPEALAAELDVRLGTPVDRITTADDAVTIVTPSGPVRSRRAILAVPAPIAKSVVDEPPDPVTRRLLETRYASSILVSLFAQDGFAPPEGLADTYGLLIPRAERCRIAGISLEHNKRPGTSATGQLLHLMLRHEEACRLMSLPDDAVIAETVGEAGRFFPSLARQVRRGLVFRWPLAEPCSPIGRASDLRRYREDCALRPPPIVLAGDYMSMPYTEGAAESGVWAAQSILDAAGERQPGAE